MRENLSSIHETPGIGHNSGHHVQPPSFKPVTDDEIRDEMKAAIRAIAWPPLSDDEKTPARIARSARRVGLTYSQARRLWYSEWRGIPAWVVDSVRARLHKLQYEAIIKERARIERLFREIARQERGTSAHEYESGGHLRGGGMCERGHHGDAVHGGACPAHGQCAPGAHLRTRGTEVEQEGGENERSLICQVVSPWPATS